MPTGTGKTETMLAWMIARRPEKLLVIVPSSTLRDQLSRKFETLGILQDKEIVSPTAHRPRVVKLEHGIADLDEAVQLVDAANVVVSTPHALHATPEQIRADFLSRFTDLVVDEAHHAPAATWKEIIRAFSRRNVLLFTATPFRTDGITVPGRVIFRFPLREAQRQGYFSKIDFSAILDLDEDDLSIANAALSRLRADLESGYEHVMLVRAKSKPRADELLALYGRLAPEYEPKIIYDRMSSRERKEALEAIASRSSRIIVCIDILGEGFDLPTLKVGAIHDSHKSLSPMIQLIGRLARTESPLPLGDASIFVKQDPALALTPLRFLLKEDPDWDKILSDVTERVTKRAEEVSEFEVSFTDMPTDVHVGLLQPKMSAIAFRAPDITWDPYAALSVYGESILEGAIATSIENDVAWFVVESVDRLRWADLPSMRAINYNLIAMHLDKTNALLYIHGSDTKQKYDDLAEAVLGGPAEPIKGYDTFRVFADLDRVVPTNIGLLDARDRDKRFSMHVGSDVESALTEAERAHKANTHIAAKAFENGDRVTIAAALGGRFWSMRSAPNLAEWRKWCRQNGVKLQRTSTDVSSLFRNMIIPVDATERPPHAALAMEWPIDQYTGFGSSLKLSDGQVSFMLTDVEFRIDDYGSEGPVKFSMVTPKWEIAYEATFGPGGVLYRPVGKLDGEVENARKVVRPLSDWLNSNKPTLFFAGDRMVTGDDRLLVPRSETTPYPRESLIALEWNGVDLTVESQGVDRNPKSIQAHMVKYLLENREFDVLIDDDRSGEAADLVGLRIKDGELRVTLVHCKYSRSATPGHRVADLYEVCGQAIRGAKWRDKGSLPLLEHLHLRSTKYQQRTEKSAFEFGDRETLFRIRQQAPQLFPKVDTVVVQPGLSIAASTDEQLRLLAGAESYVRSVTKGRFEVYCSS